MEVRCELVFLADGIIVVINENENLFIRTSSEYTVIRLVKRQLRKQYYKKKVKVIREKDYIDEMGFRHKLIIFTF